MKRASEAKKQNSPAPVKAHGARPRSRKGSARKERSAGGEGGGADRYWMLCPRCGLGLIETINGPIRTERCTACGAVWADREDVERSWGSGTPALFKSFRKG